MRKILFSLSLIFFTVVFSYAQTCANYTAVRTTGITYSSIAAFGTVVPSWRGQVGNQNDDNRSNPVAIGFDFWYLGTKYSYCNIAINGFIDFSTTSYDGNWPLADPNPQPPGYAICGGNIAYRERGQSLWNVPCGSGVPPASYDGTYWALAAMYCDIWPANGLNALAYSIKYATTGAAPNRTFTVEYINMDDWSSPGLSDYNFQIKLFETTGVIQFVYGGMNPAVGSPTPYSCGINQRIFTNPPAVSEMLVQQGTNSNTFNNTIPALSTAVPTPNSMITFTPVCSLNPGSILTFSGVGNTSMTLNWTNWSVNEIGYVIYSSTDGVNYFFHAQTAANATSYVATNLYAPTYWWKVYAVTEGCLSAFISGSQATLPGGTFISIVTGNWSNPTTWQANAVPTLGDNVIIDNGHTVIVDGNNYGCFNLTIGQGGVSGLRIGSAVVNYTFSVLGDILVNASGSFAPNTSFNATHTMNVSGNIVNNGLISFRPTPTTLINVNFIRNGNQTISGTAGVGSNQYNLIGLNMGANTTNTLEVTSTNFLAPSNFLSMTNGIFKFSVPVSAVTLDIFTAQTTVPYTCGIWMNSPNSTMIAHSTLNFQGAITCSAGTLNVGDLANETLMSDGARLTISGGTVNVAGRLDRPSYVAITHVTISNGTLNLNTLGSTSTTNAPYMVDVIGSSLYMSGGSIVIKNEGGGGAQDLGYINTGCINDYSITGGTLQIGNTTTAAAQNMRINTNIPIYNLLVNNTNTPTATIVTNDLTVLNNITINSGTLNTNTQNILIGGTWSNNGTFQQQIRRVTFNGSSAVTQGLGGTTATTFYDLTIDNTGTGGVTQTTGPTVSNTVSFTNGKYLLNGTTLTVTNPLVAAVTRTNGHAVSEHVGNLSKIAWTIGSTVGQHLFPFGTTSGYYIPFIFDVTAGTPNIVTISTYGTPATNLPWPVTPNNVANLNSTTGLLPDNRDATVNRFWQIDRSGVDGTANITFSYNPTPGPNLELPIAPYNLPADQRAQRYDIAINRWLPSTAGQTTTANSVTVPGVTLFSPWALASNLSPLPIELSHFEAACLNGAVQIEWVTQSETDNDYFTLERTADGVVFETVMIIDGAGTTSQASFYSAFDEDPLDGISFYRLKQTDMDGTETFSDMISVDCELNTSLGVTVFPNPSSGDNTLIQIKTEAETVVSVSVVNALGERLFFKAVKTGKDGSVVVPFEYYRTLPKGIYLVNAQTDKQQYTVRLIVE